MDTIVEVLTIEDIKKLLPHRHPFLLIDRVENIVPGKSCIAYKNVSYDSWFFQGHFPKYPIMPGVLIIEAMAQAAGVLAMKTIMLSTNGTEPEGTNTANGDPERVNNKSESTPNSMFFVSISNAKFRKQVIPGDTLRIEIQVLQRRVKLWKFQAQAFVKDQLSDEAEFLAMVP